MFTAGVALFALGSAVCNPLVPPIIFSHPSFRIDNHC